MEAALTETPQAQIKRQIEDPDEQFVGPYEKNGDNAFAIETLAWAAGFRITDEGFCEPLDERHDELVAALVRDRARWLKTQIVAQDRLSKPVDPGHWRWADMTTSGYARKSEEELAADRARAAERAATLRAELASLTGEEVPPLGGQYRWEEARDGVQLN